MKPGRPTPPTPAELERLIKAGDMAGAVRVADAMLAQGRRNLPAWLGRGCANLNLGHLAEADADLAKALDIAPGDPQANHLRAMVEQRLGRIDDAVARLVKLVDARSPVTAEAAVTLAEVYWFSHRHDELRALLAREAPWSTDPRIALARARVLERDDAEGALRAYLALEAAGRTPILRRVAGFDAVGLLDRLGRYREAFDLATRLHAELTPRFDLEGLLMEAREQSELVAKGARWITPRADPVEGVALVVGLPRSGTTLLEQMLDRHPAISGIGEYEGVFTIHEALVGIGLWPSGLRSLERADAERLAAEYLDGARSRRRAGAEWTFDKTLHVWRALPAIAVVLPGAALVRITRDPRDMAISMFLSNFHPQSYGFTASLDGIRRVIALERRLVPQAVEALGLRAVSVVYEELVDAPEREIRRVLDLLGLPFDPCVLAPESNPRTVLTLSHEQVRRPINRTSIGRWRNYAFAFGPEWDVRAV